MKIKRGPGWVRIELSGEIDMAWHVDHVPEVEDALRGSPVLVIFDLAQVSFMDSTGLSLLALALHRCHDEGGEVCVLYPQDFVAHTLAIAGLDQLLTVASSGEEVRQIDDRVAQLDATRTGMHQGSQEVDPSTA